MKGKRSFIRRIQLWGVIFLLSVGVGAIAVDIAGHFREFSRRAQQMRIEYIDRQKESVREATLRTVEMITRELTKSQTHTRTVMRERAQEARAVANRLYQRNRDKSPEEISQNIIDVLRCGHFAGGAGHYIAGRLSDGLCLLHPGHPELEGTPLAQITDPDGQGLIRELIDLAGADSPDFYTRRQAESRDAQHDIETICCVERFEPLGWYIGAELSAATICGYATAAVLKHVSRIRFDTEGYIFINRLNGDALVSNGRVFSGTRKLWEEFDENPAAMQAIFRQELEAARTPDGAFITYTHCKLSDPATQTRKISYVTAIPGMQWLAGAGFYCDDVETSIAALQTGLGRQITRRVLAIALVTAAITGLFLLLFNRLSGRLKRDSQLFISWFSRAAASHDPIDRGKVSFSELDHLAELANRMVADRRQAEDELRRSESNLRLVLETATNVAFIKTDANESDARVMDFSPGAEKIFGWRREEIIGHPVARLHLPEDVARFPEIRDALRQSHDVFSAEVTLMRRSGDRFPALLTIHPVFDHDGTMVATIGVAIDMTQQKRAEDARRMEDKLRSLATLAGGIAHDFNNILLGLYGSLENACESITPDHPGRLVLADAEKSMDRATQLTGRLLTFASGGDPVKKNLHLGKLVQEAVQADLAGSTVAQVFEIDEDLWPVTGDAGQLRQVISDLTRNALQAMPDGGRLFVSLHNSQVDHTGDETGLRPGRYVTTVFRDQGSGIAPAHIERIFDPYFTTRPDSNGLGLATVYSILTQHGGTIRAESEPGHGAMFCFHLPATDAHPCPAHPPGATPVTTLPCGTRVLVMDDEEAILRVVTHALKKNGCDIETVTDGQQALERYQQALQSGAPFDVVIMDLTIPDGMGGREAVQHLLQIDPNARVIVSSGYSNDPVMARYREHGFQGLLVKPFRMNALREEVARVLHSASAPPET